jgi:hypothetical protein
MLVRRGLALRTALCEVIPKTLAFFAGNQLNLTRFCVFLATKGSSNGECLWP